MNEFRPIPTFGRIWAHWQRIPNPWRSILGLVLVVLGLMGLVLPVLQGILFLAMGTSLLVGDRPWLRAKVDAWLARHGMGRGDPRATPAGRNRGNWILLPPFRGGGRSV